MVHVALYVSVLLALWLVCCSSSILYSVKQQIEADLQCGCGELYFEDISREVQAVKAGKVSQDQKYFHAKCCEKETYYECVVVVGGSSYLQPRESEGQLPTSDVSWRCLHIESPFSEGNGAQENPGVENGKDGEP